MDGIEPLAEQCVGHLDESNPPVTVLGGAVKLYINRFPGRITEAFVKEIRDFLSGARNDCFTSTDYYEHLYRTEESHVLAVDAVLIRITNPAEIAAIYEKLNIVADAYESQIKEREIDERARIVARGAEAEYRSGS